MAVFTAIFFFREKHWLFIFKHFFPLTSLSPKKIRHLWMSYVIKTIYATLWFFFFPVLFILWSNLLQHLQDSHQQNTIFFWTKLNLRDNVVWWEVATVHLQNGCSAYMWYRRCQWFYTVAAYCSFGWTSVTRGETNIKVHTHTFYRYSTLHTLYTLHFIYAHYKKKHKCVHIHVYIYVINTLKFILPPVASSNLEFLCDTSSARHHHQVLRWLLECSSFF